MARFKKLLDNFDLARIFSLGILSTICPRPLIDKVLAKFKRASQRIRLMPAHLVVYFIIALPLWRDQSQKEVLRIVCENLSYLTPEYDSLELPSDGGISKARMRLGPDVMKEIASEILMPIAPLEAPGAWFRSLRLMSLDGSCFDLPDNQANAKYFGYPSSSRGQVAFPQMRVTALVESGTHIVIAAETGPYRRSEQNMTNALIGAGKFKSDMLILADRNFYGYNLWNNALSSGAKLLWRVKSDLLLPEEELLPDGSYISTVRDSKNRNKCTPLRVRVIKYNILEPNIQDKKNVIYRLITNIFDDTVYPAQDLATLYHERWEIETLFGEIKTGLVNNHSILRGKTPDMIHQEIWGMFITHFAIRKLMAESAWANARDPDDLSFTGSVNIIRRKSPLIAVFPPRAGEPVD